MTITLPARALPIEVAPELTIRDIVKTVPPECFEKSPLQAWWGVGISVAMVALGYGALLIAPWFLLPPLWIFTGTALTGFFVLGHDCGHRSFSRSRLVNDIVGHLLFLPLLYPFYPWRFRHDHHHQYTNLLEEDNAWTPFTESIYQNLDFITKGFYLLLRGRFWWLGSIAHWAGVHFDLKSYPEHQREQARFSNSLIVVFAVILFPALLVTGGIWGLVKFFLLPWLVYHFWMSTFTIVHHTMPDIPFKTRSQWSVAQAQLTGSVHCDYPRWVEQLCHDINWHIPHHISTAIPFYNLRKAQQSLEENWGSYLYKTTFSWELMKTIGDRCHLHDEENCYKTFSSLRK